MQIQLTNGNEMGLTEFINDNPDAVYYTVSGFEIDPIHIEAGFVEASDYPIRVWANEESSIDDDGEYAIGRIVEPQGLEDAMNGRR